ncbi:MAG: pilus assembly protein N-terminal domain-containing protein [Planctomycetales bacterium]|nr:pilus assembly protein N-terminal domain-containing protein [Planctomycetales bacterium]
MNRRVVLRSIVNIAVTCVLAWGVGGIVAQAQLLSDLPSPSRITDLESPASTSVAKEESLIEKIYEPELLLRLEPAQSKIIRTKVPIQRTVISHPEIVDIQVFNEVEFEIVGKQVGETTLTIWFDTPEHGKQVLRYLVEVDNAKQEQRRREARYKELQSRINEMFPDSQIFLFPIEDKVIVRGQAADAKEAAEIMRLLGERDHGYVSDLNRWGYYNRGAVDTYRNGLGAWDDNPFDDVDSEIFVNLLRVPGVQQVMLKVRVAELVRDSSRALGADIDTLLSSVQLSHLITGGGNATAILHDGDVKFFLRAISSHGYGKILAEPTLVTISGKTAQFLAGGEFAVPTTVGVNGVGAASTTFRGFGTELNFTPTVLNKDLIRIEVAPSFSTLNADATVGGIPGLNRRSVETTVDLREGQWLAIAGLIQDEQGGQRTRLPYFGNLPLVGGLFATQNTSRFETELIVLVSPELIQPLETEELPPLLPGMTVTEPTDDDFFVRHMIEGYQGFDHRSTVWPEVERQTLATQHDLILRRLSHGVRRTMAVQKAYVSGPCGLSD